MQAGDVVWVKVEKPVFDLWGVLVSSLTFTGALALGTLLCGALLALVYILRGRHFGPDPTPLSLARAAEDVPTGADAGHGRAAALSA